MKNLPARWAALAFLALTLTACMSPVQQDSEARATIEATGYSNVDMTGWNMFGCSDKDSYSRGFTATGTNGKRVKGVVCGSMYKGWTIRVTGVL